MSKNYMAEVAALLGVEIGEVFKIKIADDEKDSYHTHYYYRLTENSGIEYSEDNINWETGAAMTLRELLMGDIRISKLPWKPINGEKYYIPYVSINKENMYEKYHWDGDRTDEAFYEQGIVFKTKEEALAMSEKILAFVKEERENG